MQYLSKGQSKVSGQHPFTVMLIIIITRRHPSRPQCVISKGNKTYFLDVFYFCHCFCWNIKRKCSRLVFVIWVEIKTCPSGAQLVPTDYICTHWLLLCLGNRDTTIFGQFFKVNVQGSFCDEEIKNVCPVFCARNAQQTCFTLLDVVKRLRNMPLFNQQINNLKCWEL